MLFTNMLNLREADEFDGNTGFDDTNVLDDEYTQSVDQIAKDVEELNTARAEESSDRELDGQDDPVNEAMIALAESEHNWNLIITAIGEAEVMSAARGREFVLEAGGFRDFIDKAKEWFVKLFTKITATFKNWFQNAVAFFRTNKSFISKYGSKLGDGCEAYYANKSNKNFKGYPFKGTENAVTKTLNNLSNDKTGRLKVILNDIERHRKQLDNDNKAIAGNTLTGAKYAYKHDVNGYRALLCGGNKNEVESSDFRKELKISLFGSEEKIIIAKDDNATKPDYITKILKNESELKDCKKAYDNFKNMINKTISELEGLKKKIEKFEPNEGDIKDKSDAITTISDCIDAEKEMKSAAFIAFTMVMSKVFAEKRQARKIANAYIFALNRKGRMDTYDKKGIKHEGGFLSNIELI